MLPAPVSVKAEAILVTCLGHMTPILHRRTSLSHRILTSRMKMDPVHPVTMLLTLLRLAVQR